MKIIIFLKKWIGGVGVVVTSIKKEFEKRGHEVICISREDDLKVSSSLKKLFKLRKIYHNIIQKENPDIIYTQDWSMALPLMFPRRLYQKKHYCCFHGNQLGKTKVFQSIIGRRLGSHLVVVGDTIKERFPKSNLIYNGVDLEMFKPLKSKRDSIGWIKKDTEVLTKKEIFDLSKRLNLKPLIAENFNIPFDKMNRNFYNKCEVFVSLPPKTAGFNLCWIEAMAAGVPKIVGNNEGVGPNLDIDKTSSSSLLETLKSANPRNYRKEIENSEFTWKNHVDKLLEIFKI